MNKLLVSVTTVIGTTAVAVPTILLTNKEGTENPPNKPQELQYTPIWKDFSSIENKDSYKQNKCLEGLGKTDWNTDNGSATLEVSSIFSSSTTSQIKSCLKVEYQKWNLSENKWSGNLNVIWTISNNEHGLVFASIANTSSGSLTFGNKVYSVQKESDKWKLKGIVKQENLNATSNDLEQLLLKQGSALSGEYQDKNYWGFDPDLDKVCQDNCLRTEEPTSSISHVWQFTLQNDSSQEIYKCFGNFEGWLSKTFESISGLDSQLTTQLQNIKGTWSKSP